MPRDREKYLIYKIVIFSLCFHMSSEFHNKSGEFNKNREGRRLRDKSEEEGGGGLECLLLYLIIVN